jgi:hypothetical protein
MSEIFAGLNFREFREWTWVRENLFAKTVKSMGTYKMAATRAGIVEQRSIVAKRLVLCDYI